jgi:6-pyruvoyltetrahydropterin/6-carboxytetrahydropterin synthase
MSYQSTKLIELGSCAFRQWRATSHCSKIHGYQLMAKFYFGGSTLDDKNWIVDFANLKQLKAILQQQFDHTLCVAIDDPLIGIIQQLHNAGGCDMRIMEGVGIEKTAEFCFKAAQTFIKETYGKRCWVEKVEVFEHEANSAIYSETRATSFSTSSTFVNTNAVSTKTIAPVETLAPIVTSENLNIPLEVPEQILHPIESPPAQHSDSSPKTGPVPLRNPTTTGYSNFFEGTSWGSR